MKAIYKMMIPGLIGLMILTTNFQTISAQQTTSNEIEKVKAEVRKRAGDGGKVVVKMKTGPKMEGFIGNILDESFDLTDPKTRQPTTIPYRDVAHVKKTGGSSGAKIALGIGIGAAIVVATVLGSIGRKRGGFCPLSCRTIL